MGLYRREGSPFWWMWLEPPPGGQPKAESTRVRADGPTPEIRAKNKQLATLVYHRRLERFNRGALGFAPKPSIGFSAYVTWYQTNVSVTHASLPRERSILKRLTAWFQDRPLTQIDRASVLEWRAARMREVQPATADRELDVLKSVLSSAVPKYLDASPIAGLKRHRDTRQMVKRRPRVLTYDEEARLLKVATDPMEKALILLALDTLIRLTDARSLRRDRDYGTYLHIEAPKVTPYDVPVSSRLRRALDALPVDGPFYFPRRWAGREGPISVNTVWRIFRRLCAAAKIPVGRHVRGVTFHSLRHTGTTRMLEAGVNPVAVAEVGGWHGIRQLERYGHASVETKQHAVNLIARRPPHLQLKRGGRKG